MNKVYLIGNLGQDPKLTTLKTGVQSVFSVATSENFKDEAGEWVSLTEWHSITCWDKFLNEKVKLLVKGDKVFLEGKIKTIQSEMDGVKRYFTNIVLQKIHKLA